ncbi:PD-(D/E)XK nuclease family protein, partial [bacterium]|nr:PD-(D/E)XK nuclease family protein [bacterium]
MTQFERKFSHTSMSTFRRCKMKYKWGYIENYAPLPGPALVKGSVGHAALGAWYPATIANPEEASDISLAVASKKLAEYEEEAGYEMPEIWDDMAIILERYYEWALENDDFKAYQIEYKFNLEIGNFM